VKRPCYQPEEEFRKSFSDEFLEDTLRTVFNACSGSFTACKNNFEPHEARDLRPHYRRGLFDQMWREVAEHHPGVTGTCEFNAAGNCHHTTITSGDVVLTASFHESLAKPVQYAVFRETLGRDNRFLFPEMDDDPPDDGRLYALLAYSVSTDHRFPRLATVVFPIHNGRSVIYPEDRVSLFALFPHVVEQMGMKHHVAEERIEDQVQPRLLGDRFKRTDEE
jgi:hypothetical protein